MKVYYHVQKSPSLAPVLSQINPMYAPASYFLKVNFSIIFPFTPRSSTWSLFLRFLSVFSYIKFDCCMHPYNKAGKTTQK